MFHLHKPHNSKKWLKHSNRIFFMSLHICSELTCSLFCLTHTHTHTSECWCWNSFADVFWMGREQWNKCSKVGKQHKKVGGKHTGAHFPPLQVFRAWGWRHSQSLTDVHGTVSWHTVWQLHIIHIFLHLLKATQCHLYLNLSYLNYYIPCDRMEK